MLPPFIGAEFPSPLFIRYVCANLSANHGPCLKSCFLMLNDMFVPVLFQRILIHALIASCIAPNRNVRSPNITNSGLDSVW